MAKTLFFDLDGTLTDSGPGIMNCAAFALERLKLPVPERAAADFPPIRRAGGPGGRGGARLSGTVYPGGKI